jgi:hypothetical protein
VTTACVYCGSRTGADPAFAEAAAAFGELLARRGIALVYGGGHVGLMGVLADAALRAGGEVHGVITRTLEEHEVAHQGLTSLEVVETMHERKAAMSDRADAFVMLPGGFGTLDEFFEAVTWTQLGIHEKPCGVLNVHGYFDALAALLEHAGDVQLIRPAHRGLVLMDPDPAGLLDRLASWTRPATDARLDGSAR